MNSLLRYRPEAWRKTIWLGVWLSLLAAGPGGLRAASQAAPAHPREGGKTAPLEARQEGSAAAATPAATESIQLADLVSEAERVHPAIKAEEQMIEAKRARVPQVKSLPDPTVSAGWMGNIRPFSVQHMDPSSYRGISAMQEFPYPGKLRLRGEIAAKDAEAESWNLEATRRQIRAEVKSAYYELWAVDQALAITQKNKDLLDKLARVAEEKYKVGKGLQQDVIRAQLEVSRILRTFTLLNQRRRTLTAKLNTLLLRSPETPMGQLAAVEKSALTYSLDELIEKGVANSPEIRRQEQLVEQEQYAVNLAQKAYYPDFRAGYDYQQRPDMPDMHGFNVGINVPIFYKKKQREGVREARYALESSKQSRESIRTALLFQVKEQYLQAKASDELLTLYTRGLVPQSALALESSLAAYQTGSLDFESLINNFTSVLEYEVNYYEELASYEKALVNLEQITGLDLAK
ncbi:MAG: TolC family protein [Acidobacteriia bacterium]|nr:TolC family protein [Terriglobia bacterium]